jgi:hypothetical protein
MRFPAFLHSLISSLLETTKAQIIGTAVWRPHFNLVDFVDLLLTWIAAMQKAAPRAACNILMCTGILVAGAHSLQCRKFVLLVGRKSKKPKIGGIPPARHSAA